MNELIDQAQLKDQFNNISVESEPNLGSQGNDLPSIENRQGQLSLRALVSSKESGILIGKQGKNVADIREATGAKAVVSKPIPGIPNRILSLTGTLDSVSKAYGLVASSFINSVESEQKSENNETASINSTSVRILVSNNLMGTVIGKQGSKIKQIQELSGSHMTATKELLGNSTERVVEIQGTSEAIRIATYEVGQLVMTEFEKAQGTVLYDPTKTYNPNYTNSHSYPNYQQPHYNPNNVDYGYHRQRYTNEGQQFMHHPHAKMELLDSESSGGSPLTRNLRIPADLVGCVIGKQGTKIAEIRRLSNSRISISKEPESEESNLRTFTIIGTADSNETAVYLIYAQIEAEKERRNQSHNIKSL